MSAEIEKVTMFTPLKKYAKFSGRSRRKEYWLWVLFNFLLGLLAFVAFICSILMEEDGVLILLLTCILSTIWSIATILPNIALMVRRIHDFGKSGWLILLGLIPCGIGSLILFIFACIPSQVGPNQYGPNPKGIGNE